MKTLADIPNLLDTVSGDCCTVHTAIAVHRIGGRCLTLRPPLPCQEESIVRFPTQSTLQTSGLDDIISENNGLVSPARIWGLFTTQSSLYMCEPQKHLYATVLRSSRQYLCVGLLKRVEKTRGQQALTPTHQLLDQVNLTTEGRVFYAPATTKLSESVL